MITPVSGFGGLVTIHCTRPNLKVQIVGDLLRSAVPEAANFAQGGDAANIFDNLVSFLARTTSIDFAPEDSLLSDDVRALQEFWALASLPVVDYRVIWDAFVLLNLDIHNEWMEALNSTIPAAVASPPELMPGAAQSDDPKPKARAKN